jgi:hypothetical protein
MNPSEGIIPPKTGLMNMALAKTSASANAAGLKTLMSLENEALAAKDLITLKHIAVNHPRTIIQAGHVFWVKQSGSKKMKIEAMSSQSHLDPTTPFTQWVTRQLNLRAKRDELTELSEWEFEDPQDETPFTYPFTHALFAPFSMTKQSGGLLFTRETPFKDVDKHIAQRLAKIFGLVAFALSGKKRKPVNVNRQLTLWSSIAFLGVISAIPIPMTTLAPAEIVPKNPFIIAAPFDGIVEDILVPPNAHVQRDMPILRYTDPSKTVTVSPRQGLAIYASRSAWQGRQVKMGEAIIQIADPSNLSLRIDAPLSMGESLKPSGRVKLFLDNSPLETLEAEITSASYFAKAMPEGHMAYETHADLDLENTQSLPRIGSRGVAKIYGPKAPLAYWLLRRPITLLRQTLGV